MYRCYNLLCTAGKPILVILFCGECPSKDFGHKPKERRQRLAKTKKGKKIVRVAPHTRRVKGKLVRVSGFGRSTPN
jgi:hypothetical protein